MYFVCFTFSTVVRCAICIARPFNISLMEPYDIRRVFYLCVVPQNCDFIRLLEGGDRVTHSAGITDKLAQFC